MGASDERTRQEESAAKARQERLKQAARSMRLREASVELPGALLNDAWETLAGLMDSLRERDCATARWREEREKSPPKRKPNVSELARRHDEIEPSIHAEQDVLMALFEAGWRLPAGEWPQGEAWSKKFLQEVFLSKGQNPQTRPNPMILLAAKTHGQWMSERLERNPSLWPDVLAHPIWGAETLSRAAPFDPSNPKSRKSAARAMRAACREWEFLNGQDWATELIRLGAPACLSALDKKACLSAWLPRGYKLTGASDACARSLSRWIQIGAIDPRDAALGLQWAARRELRAEKNPNLALRAKIQRLSFLTGHAAMAVVSECAPFWRENSPEAQAALDAAAKEAARQMEHGGWPEQAQSQIEALSLRLALQSQERSSSPELMGDAEARSQRKPRRM